MSRRVVALITARGPLVRVSVHPRLRGVQSIGGMRAAFLLGDTVSAAREVRAATPDNRRRS